jgi:undecaprenyl diphosphate synthase
MSKFDLPNHVAIIMDGNGRWAKKRFLPRLAGHKAGVEAAKKTVKYCIQRKIPILSLFAFSSENWRRPASEVNHLMDLFLNGLEREVEMFQSYEIQLRFIGNRARFSPQLQQKIEEVEFTTANNKKLILIIAADYGGQWDICQACEKLIKKMVSNEEKVVTPDMIEAELSCADLPHPDLFIRTSGELRLSNFMLWQLAYAELYFTKALWPDFDEAEFNQALKHYSMRERRYGLTSATMD